jgi:uncharacterized protein YegJ (DUF2314 family)
MHGNLSLPSLALLLKRARQLNLTEIEAAAKRAFTEPCAKSHDDNFESLDNKCVVVQGDTGLILVTLPGLILVVRSADAPFFGDVGGVADRTREFRAKRAIQEHTAWIGVSQLDVPPSTPATAYRAVGKLIAALCNVDCLALVCMTTGQITSYSDDLLPKLRSVEPLSAFSVQHADPKVFVGDGDREMQAAQAEARQRWPDFVAAFGQRLPMQGFAVKVPFGDGPETEFMWVEVAGLDGETITGRLVNVPASMKTVRLNDTVVVNLADLNDWIYSDGETMIGGFTSKVLSARQSPQH